MRPVIIFTDPLAGCDRALRVMDSLGIEVKDTTPLLAVLEDLYKLERASTSLGLPIPPDTVPTAKEEITRRLNRSIRDVLGLERVNVKVVVGSLIDEAKVFIQENEPDIIVWGCNVSTELCRFINTVNIPSLLIK